MSAVGTLFADTNSAERQIEVIDENEHVLHGDFLLLEPVSDSVAAEVHVGGRFQEHHFGVLDTTFGDEPIPFVLPLGIHGCSKRIDHHETDVMACTCVLVAYITETYY